MKNKTPKKVFIKEKDEYIEITYAQLCKDPSFRSRLFIPLYGMLLEVTKADYEEFYRGLHRQAYLDTRSSRHGDILFNSFDSEEFNGEDLLIDNFTDVAEQAIFNVLLGKLNNVINNLEPHERSLIDMHFFNEVPQTDIAKLYGVNQSNISRRILKILEKLKKMIEN